MTIQELKQAIRLDGLSFNGGIRRLQRFTEGLAEAMELLEELEQYKALGTVEELKEAKEKQIPQTPTLEGDGYCPEGNLVYDTWICPNCEKDYEVYYDDYDYCPNCGQKIDKSEMGVTDNE